jgi:hypothetical protein
VRYFREAEAENVQSRFQTRMIGNRYRPKSLCPSSPGANFQNSLPTCTGFRLVRDGDQLELFREAMQKGGVKEDRAPVTKKISLAKNNLLSPTDLKGSDKNGVKTS